MTTLFKICIPTIIEHEGGYVDNIHDLGGVTKYGISLRFLKGLSLSEGDIDKDGDIDKKDIEILSRENAEVYYFRYFWNIKYEDINDTCLILHLFDMSVNAGTSIAVKLLQKCCGCTVDGILGKDTINMVNICDDIKNKYIAARIKFYNDIVLRDKTQKVFLKGWLNRVKTTVKI